MKKITLKQKKTNVWNRAKKLAVFRQPAAHSFYGLERIDPGVNFFVLMLEQIGAQPVFSCEGHPNGFYVLFNAPIEIAEKVRKCGYFRVELEGVDTWSIRLRDVADEKEKRQILRWAAPAWERGLGRLKFDQ